MERERAENRAAGAPGRGPGRASGRDGEAYAAARGPSRRRVVQRRAAARAARARARAAAPRIAAPAVAPSAWSIPTLRMPAGAKEFEDLVGGRVLAWVGGLAVLLGLVFLFALGISNGWIGEEARDGPRRRRLRRPAGPRRLAPRAQGAHGRRARRVATGISGLFVAVTVAAQVYDLVPQLLAVRLGDRRRRHRHGAGRALGVARHRRARHPGRARGADPGRRAGDGGTMVLLFVALASAAGVLLWLRWNWLALAAFMVATPQWVAYAADEASALEAIAVLVAFGALGVAVAVGHDLRIRAERLHSVVRLPARPQRSRRGGHRWRGTRLDGSGGGQGVACRGGSRAPRGWSRGPALRADLPRPGPALARDRRGPRGCGLRPHRGRARARDRLGCHRRGLRLAGPARGALGRRRLARRGSRARRARWAPGAVAPERGHRGEPRGGARRPREPLDGRRGRRRRSCGRVSRVRTDHR